MLIEIFIFFQVLVVGSFIAAFFTKQEILWAISAFFSGVVMTTSWSIEYYVYVYNTTLMAYEPVALTSNYPYLFGINLMFFSLSLILGIYDLFDKYGWNFFKKK